MEISPAPAYAGFWERTAASILDIILLTIPLVVLQIVYPKSMHDLGVRFLQWIVPALITLGFWIAYGATPGKMVMGLRIVRATDLAPPSIGQWCGRYLAYGVSFIPFGLGYLWVGWDPRKQGFHDKLANTVVLRTRRNTMTGWKIFLACGMGLVIALGAGGWTAKRWFQKNKERLMQAGIELRKEGLAFGKNHSAEECQQEAFRRLDACDGMICESETKLFFKYSLSAKPRDPRLCVSVPSRKEIMQSAFWGLKQCKALGRPSDQACSRLMQTLQEYCATYQPSYYPLAP